MGADISKELRQTFAAELKELLERLHLWFSDNRNDIACAKKESAEPYSIFRSINDSATIAGLPEYGRAANCLLNLVEASSQRKRKLSDFSEAFNNLTNAMLAACDDLRRNGEQSSEDLRKKIDEIEELHLSDANVCEENRKAYSAKSESFEKPTDESFRVELQRIFRLEGSEHIANLERLLSGAEEGSTDPNLLSKIFRILHTAKGAAATAGFTFFADTCHQLESLLENLLENGRSLERNTLDRLERCVRGLRRMLDLWLIDDDDVERTSARILDIVRSIAPSLEPDLEKPGDSGRTQISAHDDGVEQPLEPFIDRDVRVSMGQLDHVMNLVLELHIHRSRLDELTGAFDSLSKKLKWERRNLNKSVGEFQRKHQWAGFEQNGSQADSSGFSELEFDRYSDLAVFSRNLEEMDFKIGSIIKKMEDKLARFVEDGDGFSGIVGSIRDDMIQIRMVPVDTLFRRIGYQTRMLARRLDKLVSLRFLGERTEIDKGILDGLADIMLHIIRNSLDHGIEPPQERERLGKNRQGVISVSAETKERNVVFCIEDDGAGVDLDKIAKAAVAAGIAGREDIAARTDRQLLDMIFHPRLSTRQTASEISGRGMGMDAVRHAISELYGSINVESKRHEGTRITIKLPLTMAIQPIVNVSCEPYNFNIPMHYVETILEAPEPQSDDKGKQWIEFRGCRLPVCWLSGYFRLSYDSDTATHPALILRDGDNSMALMVDAVTGRDEVIVRPLSPLLQSCVHFLGSTLTPQGEVRLVLNIPYLFSLPDNLPARMLGSTNPARRVKVLVADDSLSVRQTVKFMLQKHGLTVNTAKDGLLAWQKQDGIRSDLLIVDLEMPNLNGYELMKRIRQHPDFGSMPMIVLTSRGGEKHHQQAMTAGADGFLTKPILEKKLISIIRDNLSPELGAVLDENDPTRG